MKRPSLYSASLGLAAFAAAVSPEPAAAAVTLDAELAQSAIVDKAGERIHLRIAVRGSAETAGKRPGINAAIVIDRSGSMAGDRIVAAREAAAVALERLSPDDVVSLVAYNHKVDVLHAAQALGSSRDGLVRAIERLQADGTTALYAGVEEGGKQAQEFLSDSKVNRVILVSDGLANVGPSTPREVAELGRQLAGKGISVTTIGLGLDYNEDLMQRLAAASDGNHAFVESPRQLAGIFDKEFGDALSVSAKDIIIEIECQSGFAPKRVLGRDAVISGNRVTLNVNQLQSSNERYAILELEVPKDAQPGTAKVAAITSRYHDLASGAEKSLDTTVEVRVTSDAKEADASVNKTVMSQVTAQVATETTEKAVELRDKGDTAGARKMLEDNAAYLNRQKSTLGTGAAAAPSAALTELDELEKKSKEAAGNLDSENWTKQRKAMRYDQYKTKSQQSY